MTIQETSQPVVQSSTERTPDPARSDSLAFAALGFGMMALVAAVIAVGIAIRAVDESQSVPAVAAQVDSPSVALDDFGITPSELTVARGSVLEIDNVGASTHNLSVEGLASAMIASGGSESLDLGSLEPGTYEMRCDVSGHADLGMVGTITIE
jgi:uncharacterized cupredoxin-like copper-binding protein